MQTPPRNPSTVAELLASPTNRAATAPGLQNGFLQNRQNRPLSERAQRILDLHLRYEVYHPALAQIPVEAARFMDSVLNFDRPHWLSILGPSGIGKTFINLQICKLLAKWWKVQTATGKRSPWIVHIIPSADLRDYNAPKDYAEADLVFVEDIGIGAGDDKGSGTVTKSRINELLQLRTGKWTLLDANLYRYEIGELMDARISSRMKRDDSVLIEIPPDARVPDFNDK